MGLESGVVTQGFEEAHLLGGEVIVEVDGVIIAGETGEGSDVVWAERVRQLGRHANLDLRSGVLCGLGLGLDWDWI